MSRARSLVVALAFAVAALITTSVIQQIRQARADTYRASSAAAASVGE